MEAKRLPKTKPTQPATGPAGSAGSVGTESQRTASAGSASASSAGALVCYKIDCIYNISILCIYIFICMYNMYVHNKDYLRSKTREMSIVRPMHVAIEKTADLSTK